MTEGFATTVAAVAPVIWLVAAVEYQQVTKRFGALVNAREAALKRELEALESGAGAPSEGGGASAAQPSIHFRPLSAVWSVMSAFLAGATLLPLKWLATPGAGPNPTLALFCYWVIAGGLCIVTLFPVAMVLWDAWSSLGRRADLVKRIEALRAQDEPQVPSVAAANSDVSAAGSPHAG